MQKCIYIVVEYVVEINIDIRKFILVMFKVPGGGDGCDGINRWCAPNFVAPQALRQLYSSAGTVPSTRVYFQSISCEAPYSATRNGMQTKNLLFSPTSLPQSTYRKNSNDRATCSVVRVVSGRELLTT